MHSWIEREIWGVDKERKRGRDPSYRLHELSGALQLHAGGEGAHSLYIAATAGTPSCQSVPDES